MSLLGSYWLRPAAGSGRWVVALLVAVFALAGFAHGGPVRPASAHEAAMAVASEPAATVLSDHAMGARVPHLPGPVHDAKSGSCPLCGALSDTVGPTARTSFDRAAAPPSSPTAAGLAPPLPPPRLRA